ncbi:MAG: hypothetical protein FJ271_01990 [Planctomycetes bacterium]|nr:hypothetical protein [Planctomycetota bacterium]
MKQPRIPKGVFLFSVGLLATWLVTGCDAGGEPTPAPSGDAAQAPKGPAKKVEVGKNVFLEVQGERRLVRVNAYVCLRKGQLEQLLTRKRTKEHEAVLAADVDARLIHAALTLARAEPGKPVQFVPKFVPPSGSTIKVSLEYVDPQTKKTVKVPANKWIRNLKSKKHLETDWVFAGSVLIDDPLDKTKKPFYAANDGDIICLSNFDTAMLDLPVSSSRENNDLVFEADTDRIPPVETPVQVILEPIAKMKK